MATILDEIVATKWKEIEQAKLEWPLARLEKSIAHLPPTRNFTSALTREGMRIITEVKKASPSAGIIREDFNPTEIARIYEANGADCISVLTDTHYFQGKLSYLTAIHDTVRIPCLRKEFILDRHQLLEARHAGADAVLLIAEILPGNRLQELYDDAKEIGLHVLIELHDAEEVSRVVDTGSVLIGINNRNLRTFKTSLDHTLNLLPSIPKDRCVVSESGIKTHADLVYLESAGVKAVLVGESLMRSADIGQALRELKNTLRE